MSTEANKDLVRGYFQMYNAREFDRTDEYLAENVVAVIGSRTKRGSDAIRQANTQVTAKFPDAKLSVEDMIAEGDKVVARVTFTGTDLGEPPGDDRSAVPATGRTVEIPGVRIARVEDGRIAEIWGVDDSLAAYQQLELTKGSDEESQQR